MIASVFSLLGIQALSPPQGTKEQMVEVIGRMSAAYPPSAGNSPTAFAWALFGTTLVTLMSIATILRIWGLQKRYPLPMDNPVSILRMQVAMFLMTIFIGTSGDVLVAAFWNEVHPATMAVLMTIDKIGDGLIFVPFMAGTFMAWILRSQRQRIAQRMIDKDPHDLRAAINRVQVSRSYMEDVRDVWHDGRNAVYLTLACAAASGLIAYVKWESAIRWMGQA